MNLPLTTILLLIGLLASTYGFGLDLSPSSEDELLLDDESQGRLLFLGNLGGGFNINATILAALAAALAASFMSLLNLAGLGLLLAENLNDDEDMMKTHYYPESSGGHSSYRRMSSALVDIDWEILSFSDWISLMMDTYNSFHPTDVECQKRFICEVHQKSKELGPIAQELKYYFSYMRYGEVFSLPMSLKMLVEDYIDAADKGRVLQKDCGDIFTSCDFSILELIGRYKPKKHKQFHSGNQNRDNYIK